ncbi:hypothetical protein VitviT2T_016086 [Vitis vinifera]|uniref:Uncharacterized protein n=1 Tax=Vitis vinifera TaxID=29760 RepID=A0ABY9CQV0_VITVI|nr:hypothetical protein VitviT2T_016086 [Vitis vinifera]
MMPQLFKKQLLNMRLLQLLLLLQFHLVVMKMLLTKPMSLMKFKLSLLL